MILIITHKQDYTADFVINKLNEAGTEYLRLNCEDLANLDYVFSVEKGFELGGHTYENIRSVWFRRTQLPDVSAVQVSDSDKVFLVGEYEALLNNIYQCLSRKIWLSHPNAVFTAENKLLQLQTAIAVGFTVPDTLVTNKHETLKEFATKHRSKIIAKPISQGRIHDLDGSGIRTIYTNLIPQHLLDSLDDFLLTPAIYQPYVEKSYELRVTVVGDCVFAAKVDSQSNENTSIDWRREKAAFAKYSLPQDIQTKCITITARLGLSFGAIDLVKTPQGEYIFLEINPNGQWAWLEAELGMPISDKIIEFLTL